MKQYQDLIKHVLHTGLDREGRHGSTISSFGYHYDVPTDPFPLLTTKKINWSHIIIENLWFLSGEPSVDLLHHYGIRFWDPWLDPHTNAPPTAYGAMWARNDQLDRLVTTAREDPFSRRLVCSAWIPDQALDSALPPCHAFFVVNIQPDNTLNLHLTQRSGDIALGIPYNLAGYAFLTRLFAHILNREPGTFSHTIVDAHICTAPHDHVPNLVKQLLRDPRPLPQLSIDSSIKTLTDVRELAQTRPPLDELLDIFKLTGYDPYPPLKFGAAV